jgi:hypothetical protein
LRSVLEKPREEALKQIAREWCEDEGIPFE